MSESKGITEDTLEHYAHLAHRQVCGDNSRCIALASFVEDDAIPEIRHLQTLVDELGEWCLTFYHFSKSLEGQKRLSIVTRNLLRSLLIRAGKLSESEVTR